MFLVLLAHTNPCILYINQYQWVHFKGGKVPPLPPYPCLKYPWNHYTITLMIYYYIAQGVNVAKCISNGHLHFVDCLTQLLGGSSSDGVNRDLDLKSRVDTATPLKSYSLYPKSVCVVLSTVSELEIMIELISHSLKNSINE